MHDGTRNNNKGYPDIFSNLSSLLIGWEKYRWNPVLAGTIESSVSIIHDVTRGVGEIGTILGPMIQ